jgi:hypothetical protein
MAKPKSWYPKLLHHVGGGEGDRDPRVYFSILRSQLPSNLPARMRIEIQSVQTLNFYTIHADVWSRESLKFDFDVS